MESSLVFAGLVEEDSFALETALLAVSDLMTPEVVTIPETRPLADAISIFNERGFRHLVVVDGTQVAGVLSDRSALRALVRNPDAQATPVRTAMTKDPITIRPHATVSEAIHLLLTNRINCLPVVADDGSVRGILTTTDLLRAQFSLQRWLESRGRRLSS
jgi:acetoin utilization protein AcuB